MKKLVAKTMTVVMFQTGPDSEWYLNAGFYFKNDAKSYLDLMLAKEPRWNFKALNGVFTGTFEADS